MSYYGTSVDAKLYMGAATSVPLPAPGSDSFTEVPLLGQITPPPKEIAVATFNVLNDTNKRSVGGKKADQLCEGRVILDWDEGTVHETMEADLDVAGGQKRNWRLEYPNGRIRNFVGFLSKFTEEEFNADSDGVPHAAAFTIAVDGAVATTP